MQELIQEVISQHVSDDDNSNELSTDTLTYDDVQDEVDDIFIDDDHEQVTVKDASTNTDLVTSSDVGIQSVALMVHVDVQTDEIDKKDAEVQAIVTTEEASTDVNTKLLNNKDVSTLTEDLCAPLAELRLETFKDDDKAVRFYTGFPLYKRLMIYYNFLGPAVAALCYHESSSGKEASFMGRHRSLLIWDLTINGLRIVTTWLDFIFHKFKEIPIWPSRHAVYHFMPDCFRSLYTQTRCVIDATELFIETPSNPSAQQLTFSNYKNHNTLKALVGITPSGAVCFVSDLYGGNISDKKLTVESDILKLFECGDSIMADRGFNIEDILPPRVCLNIPPRINKSGQLTDNERAVTRRIASVRIHVERAIKRIKNHQILHLIPNSMHSSANQLFLYALC